MLATDEAVDLESLLDNDPVCQWAHVGQTEPQCAHVAVISLRTCTDTYLTCAPMEQYIRNLMLHRHDCRDCGRLNTVCWRFIEL